MSRGDTDANNGRKLAEKKRGTGKKGTVAVVEKKRGVTTEVKRQAFRQDGEKPGKNWRQTTRSIKASSAMRPAGQQRTMKSKGGVEGQARGKLFAAKSPQRICL